MNKNVLILLFFTAVNSYTDKINLGLENFYNTLEKGQIIQAPEG
jgi:hypothetical protein